MCVSRGGRGPKRCCCCCCCCCRQSVLSVSKSPEATTHHWRQIPQSLYCSPDPGQGGQGEDPCGSKEGSAQKLKSRVQNIQQEPVPLGRAEGRNQGLEHMVSLSQLGQSLRQKKSQFTKSHQLHPLPPI